MASSPRADLAVREGLRRGVLDALQPHPLALNHQPPLQQVLGHGELAPRIRTAGARSGRGRRARRRARRRQRRADVVGRGDRLQVLELCDRR